MFNQPQPSQDDSLILKYRTLLDVSQSLASQYDLDGLTAATFITLLLVPVIYAIFVLDLKLVRWESTERAKNEEAMEEGAVLAT
jgi:hypothetical protein